MAEIVDRRHEKCRMCPDGRYRGPENLHHTICDGCPVIGSLAGVGLSEDWLRRRAEATGQTLDQVKADYGWDR